MRKPFIQKMEELAERDPRVILIIGDVGFTYMQEYIKKFPNQFLNIGVLEQTMMSAAYGMSKAGWKPYIYTMLNFIIFRPYEQIRNDICHQNANVKLFGVGGDIGYNFMGFGHNVEKGEEEKALGHLPNLHRYYPDTEEITKEIMESEYHREGPSFMKL
ncbi:MAG: transketolase [Patescibacteria group bacterium]|jgi:transketolase|nr:transketolase [Patescibacteria group bacterium]MDQ5954283.1 transketolase [Patescibacteria group bacterium]